jgi:PAS domain S-box-containing protein
VNQVWLEFAGQTLDFVRSHPAAWMTAVHPEDREMAAKIFWEGVHSGQGFAIETRSLRARDGTYRWHLQQAVVLRNAEGKVLKFVGTTTDIDDQKRTAEALRQAQAELAHATRVTTVGELAASIAHEVKQPLGAVVTNADACLRWLNRPVPDLNEAREAVHRVIRDGKRGSEVIERIRALLKHEEPSKARVDVNETIRIISGLTQNELSGIDLQLNLEKQLPYVSADRIQLQQVLLNLILNAVDAMKSVSDRPRVLCLETKRHEANGVLVAVKDSGVGLRPDAIKRLFETFYTTKPAGLGMGLSISRSIVESHGGRLWAKANDGHGATFLFTLPAENGGLA